MRTAPRHLDMAPCCVETPKAVVILTRIKNQKRNRMPACHRAATVHLTTNSGQLSLSVSLYEGGDKTSTRHLFWLPLYGLGFVLLPSGVLYLRAALAHWIVSMRHSCTDSLPICATGLKRLILERTEIVHAEQHPV